MNNSNNDPNDPTSLGTESVETRRVHADQTVEAPPPITSVPPTIPPGSIAFYIPGNDNPILFHDRSSVVIGRRTPESPDVDLDLTPNQGAELGVSRRHTIIDWNGKEFFITDLNSSNGTFLNERRLRPSVPETLRRGDQVRVGQLLMVIYITLQQTLPDREVMLYIVDINRTRRQAVPVRAISPAFLQVVAAYIQVLANLQQTILMAKNKNTQHFTISNMILTETHLEMALAGVTEGLPPICKLLASLQPATTIYDTPSVPDSTVQLPSTPTIKLATTESDPTATVEIAGPAPQPVDNAASTNGLHMQLAQRLISELEITWTPQSAILQNTTLLLQRLLEMPVGLSLVPLS